MILTFSLVKFGSLKGIKKNLNMFAKDGKIELLTDLMPFLVKDHNNLDEVKELMKKIINTF